MAPPDSDSDADSDSESHDQDADGDVNMAGGSAPVPARPRSQEGEIAKAERAAAAKYLELTSVPTIEEVAKRIVEVAGKVQRNRAEQKQSDVADISELVPKKANADLKRELARRIGGLEKQTEVVMFEMLRERIQSGGGASDSHLAALIDSMYRQQDGDGRARNGSGSTREGGHKWVSEWDQA